MQSQLQQAKDDLIRTRDRMARLLTNTPDDRINWSPSATARTPIEQVVHSAISIDGILMLLQEKPRLCGEFGRNDINKIKDGIIDYPFATVAEMDAAFRVAEKQFTTREQALDLLEQKCSEFIQWLDSLTPEQFAATVHSQFVGSIPVAFGTTIPTMHTNVHIAQLEYIQTIYGDLEWHA